MDLKDYEKIKDLPETTNGTDGLSKKDKKDKYLLMALAEENPARLAYDKLLSLESANPEFIMNIIPKNKNVIKYMAESLKQDERFLTDVIKKYPGSIPEVLKNCNVIITDVGTVMIAEDRVRREEEIYVSTKAFGEIPANYIGSSDNEKVMSSMIAKDAAMILLVSDSLKDNKEFIKVESLKNRDVLQQVVDNADDFGVQGLEGAKEANIEIAVNDIEDKYKAKLKARREELAAQGLSEEEISQDPKVRLLENHFKNFDIDTYDSKQKEIRFRNARKSIKTPNESFEKAVQSHDKLTEVIQEKSIEESDRNKQDDDSKETKTPALSVKDAQDDDAR